MELSIWGIILAIILFVVGLKVAKWILWGLAILIALIAGWTYFF